MAAPERRFYIQTPCLQSRSMTRLAGFPVYMKLENLQPSGSFKLRGLSVVMQKAHQNGCISFVIASGGNAAFSAVYSARMLNRPITVVFPESTPQFVADLTKLEGANVVIHGNAWNDANVRALEIYAKTPGCAYIHPFDGADCWDGHGTMIEEVENQLSNKPDVLVTCVGGGGLLIGIMAGLRKVGWDDLPVVAMETQGAHCFNAAIKAGKLVTLPKITSVAVCLGALTVHEKALECYQKHKIISVVVDDKDAVNACLQFADNERMLVQPACGAALSAIFSNILSRLQEEGKLTAIKSALVIVCGGKSVNLAYLDALKKKFGL